MLRNVTNLFSKKKRSLEEEIILRAKIEGTLHKFLKEEVLKKTDIKYKLSYTVNKGVIKLETDNKLIAQEIAIRIRTLEEKLRNNEIDFKKLLI